MTRKNELYTKANEIVESILARDVCLSEAECVIVQEVVRVALLEVEREVLARVNRYYSNQVHYDMDDYPDKFVTWLRAQQQELE